MASVFKGLRSFSKNPYSQFDQDGPVSPFPQLRRSNSKGGFFSSPIGSRRSSSKPLNGPVKQEKAFAYFALLPYELQCEIMKFVGFPDICNVQRSSKLLSSIASENLVWKELYQTHWKVPAEILDKYGAMIKDWQAHFKQQHWIHKKAVLRAEKIKDCATKPPSRFAHSSAMLNNHIYYIGGQVSEERSNQIWDYNVKLNQFNQVQISNYNPIHANAPPQADLKEDFSNFIGVDGLVPKFARHQSVLIGHKVYSFGGFDYTYFYNLSVFNIKKKTWKYPNVSGDLPLPRSNHSVAVVGHCIYIFGGSVGDKPDKYTVTNHFYKFNTKTKVWSKINASNTPTERVGHVMAAIGNQLYLFGGGIWGKTEGWSGQNNDLYIFDTIEEKWELQDVPKEERPPVCTYPFVFVLKNNLCIFGGAAMIGTTVTNKMYLWDPLVKKWKEMKIEGDAITPRSIGTANVIGEDIVFWGGYCGGVMNNDNDLFKIKMKWPAKLSSCLGSN